MIGLMLISFLNPDSIPNQRWHWIQYIMYRDVVKDRKDNEFEFKETFKSKTGRDYSNYNSRVREITIDDNSKSRLNIFCPEQLLWIAKAVKIDNKIINDAKEYMEKFIIEHISKEDSLKVKYSKAAVEYLNREYKIEGKTLIQLVEEKVEEYKIFKIE